MKSRFFLGLVVGAVLVVVLLGISAFIYFGEGFAPVATSAAPMPFETTLAHLALHAKLRKLTLKTAPIKPSETNLVAGAAVYRENCAVCHGLPGAPKTAIAAGMFPHPPQLFHGDGVTDDPPGETYWKAVNGIRLTGMPGFGKSLKNDQLWQVSLLLAHANSLPSSVKKALAPGSSPPSNGLHN